MIPTLSSTFSLTLVGDTEIVMTRQFRATRALVFKAFSSCEHLSKWLGPRFLTMVYCDMDFREGGSYRYVHRDADGAEYGFRGDIREIVEPEKIRQTFEFELMPGHVSEETVVLTEANGITTIVVTSKFGNKEDRDGMARSGMEAGVTDSYDRLEEYLKTLA